MKLVRVGRSGARAARTALVTVAALVAVGFSGAAADALEVTDVSAPVTGNATHFDALGAPYGGCGIPQSVLETQDFVALNVYNTPGDYAFYQRPLAGADLAKAGLWNNGRNCGRWVRVSIGDFCTGTNDGARNQPFCRNGSWVADEYNGATLDMLVADSCGDDNAWCRDDPYHLDLATPSLSRFTKNGAPVSGLSTKWNNRHVDWQFIPAPHYSGDLSIGFMQNAFNWWPAIAVTNLPDGIHGVEYLAPGNVWTAATPNGDMGQSFVIGPTVSAGTEYRIRVRDVHDAYVNGGREYAFSLPSACSPRCSSAFTPVTYTTSGGTTTTTTTTTTTRPTTTTTTTTRPTTTTTTSAGTGCTAAYAVVGSWPGGFQGQVTVTAGAAPVSAWSATWTLGAGQSVTQWWSSTLTTTGSAVTATGAAWNGALAPGTSTTFGFIGSGPTGSVPLVSCTAR